MKGVIEVMRAIEVKRMIEMKRNGILAYPAAWSQFMLLTAVINVLAMLDHSVDEAVSLIQAAILLPRINVSYMSMFASVFLPPWPLRPQSSAPVTYKRPVESIFAVIKFIAGIKFDAYMLVNHGMSFVKMKYSYVPSRVAMW